jgi:hypothetical protein
MDEHPEIEDCVTMAQFNDMRQNIEDRQIEWPMICKLF